MLSHEHDAMFEMEDVYWWYVGRRRLVLQLIERFARGRRLRILDVGCGTGANAAAFGRFGDVIGVDNSEYALRFCKEKRGVDAKFSQAEHLPFADASFEVVTALDVIEHTDNDIEVMRELSRVCADDGVLIATVPAYGFLWSEHDEALQHRRRYVAHALRMRATAAGLDVIRTTYFITLLFIPILAVRLWQGLFKRSIVPKTDIIRFPTLVNRFLASILSLERALIRFMNLPFGVSILMIARPHRERGSTGSAPTEAEGLTH